MKLKEMTASSWKSLKKGADIQSSDWFKPAHAEVGKYIKALNDARAKWHSGKGSKELRDYFTALGKVQSALTDFLKKKEFKTPAAEELAKEIQGWLQEIDDKQVKLAKIMKENEPKLKSKDKDNLDDVFKLCNW